MNKKARKTFLRKKTKLPNNIKKNSRKKPSLLSSLWHRMSVLSKNNYSMKKKRLQNSNFLRKRRLIKTWLNRNYSLRMDNSRDTSQLKQKLNWLKKSKKSKRAYKKSLKRTRTCLNRSWRVLCKRMNKSLSNNKNNRWFKKNPKWRIITTRPSKKKRIKWIPLFSLKLAISKNKNSMLRRWLSSNSLYRKTRNSSKKLNRKLRTSTSKRRIPLSNSLHRKNKNSSIILSIKLRTITYKRRRISSGSLLRRTKSSSKKLNRKLTTSSSKRRRPSSNNLHRKTNNSSKKLNFKLRISSNKSRIPSSSSLLMKNRFLSKILNN